MFLRNPRTAQSRHWKFPLFYLLSKQCKKVVFGAILVIIHLSFLFQLVAILDFPKEVIQ